MNADNTLIPFVDTDGVNFVYYLNQVSVLGHNLIQMVQSVAQ